MSKKRADAIHLWDELEELKNENKTINVTINAVVKGGVTADIKGVRAFMPASMASLHRIEDLNSRVGKTMEVAIAELDKDKKKIILSRKEAELRKQRKRRLSFGLLLRRVKRELVRLQDWLALEPS